MSAEPTTRHERWRAFLAQLCIDERVPEAQRRSFVSAWERLQTAEPAIAYPTVTRVEGEALDNEVVTERRQMLVMSWNPTGRTLEVQVTSGGVVAWWFANHTTNEEASGIQNQGYAEYAERFRYTGDEP